jgi:hypothetical protein
MTSTQKGMASHTPGPWKVEPGPPCWVVAVNTPEDGGDLICNNPDYDCDASMARWPANARLIAAAPDLRKAASFALAVLYGSNSDHAGAVRALEKAIDKAELGA